MVNFLRWTLPLTVAAAVLGACGRRSPAAILSSLSPISCTGTSGGGFTCNESCTVSVSKVSTGDQAFCQFSDPGDGLQGGSAAATQDGTLTIPFSPWHPATCTPGTVTVSSGATFIEDTTGKQLDRLPFSGNPVSKSC
jgi:hypothetical protein